MYELIAISTGSATSALLLAAEHVLLWNQKDQLGLTGRYRLGTIALSVGQATALLLLAKQEKLSWWSTLGAIAGPVCIGGGTIEALHYWRRQRGQSPWPDTLFEAGRVAGRAEARRNGTTREF